VSPTGRQAATEPVSVPCERLFLPGGDTLPGGVSRAARVGFGLPLRPQLHRGAHEHQLRQRDPAKLHGEAVELQAQPVQPV
jgi:hypothetical protein